MTNGSTRQTRSFGVFLVVVSLLHAALLLIPSVRQIVLDPTPAPVLAVRLQTPAAAVERVTEPPPTAPQRVAEATPPPPPATVRPAPESAPPAAREPETEPEPPVITAHRIISDLAEARRRDPLVRRETDTEPAALFRAPIGASLDDVLNEPVLQLPFRDRRIYLVDSYDAGVVGGIDRFFDRVTVPFAFQTKNNLRVQCAWVLILAGCSWGDASLFYAADKARKRPRDEG